MAVVGVGVAPVGVGCGGATPPEEQISDDRSGTGRAHRSIGIRAESRWRNFGMPRCPRAPHPGGWHPLRPQRSRRADGPGHIEPQAVLTPIFLDAPGQFGDSAAAGERIGVKNPSRAGSAGKKTSEPGYHPHRLRYGTEIPRPRHLLRGVGGPTLPDPANRPRRYTLLGEASRFASTVPENLRPPTRHRNLHRPTHTDISKTANQQNYTTTQLHNDTTTKQNSTTGKQKTMTSVSTEVSQY